MSIRRVNFTLGDRGSSALSRETREAVKVGGANLRARPRVRPHIPASAEEPLAPRVRDLQVK